MAEEPSDFQFRDLNGPSFDDADEAAVIDDDAQGPEQGPERAADDHRASEIPQTAAPRPVEEISEADIYSPDDPIVAPPAAKSEWRQPRTWLLIVGLLVVIAIILLVLSSVSASDSNDAARPGGNVPGKAKQGKKSAKAKKHKKKQAQKAKKHGKNYDPDSVVLLPPDKKKKQGGDKGKQDQAPTVVIP